MHRCGFEARLAAGLWLVGMLIVVRAGWLALGQDALDWRHAVLLASVVASGWCALIGQRRIPSATLDWDGQRWSWVDRTGHTAGVVAVRLDLQRRVLVRWQAQHGAVHWVWLEAAAAAGRWHEVRCALRAATRVDPAASVTATHA